ncbi:MAG: cytochrome b/b6 domain-containing protein, partial [Alloalcanivorax xenomutans]
MDTIRVWDLPTRLFHWLLVAAIGFLWYSGGEGEALMVWHMRAGYLVLGLVIFRIIWGLWGSRHSRFAAFLAGPRRTLDYGKAFARGRAPVFAGHNPLGGWMVMLMLLSLLVQTATGLFATDDISLEGPLSGQVGGATARAHTDVHFWYIDLRLILIAAHGA